MPIFRIYYYMEYTPTHLIAGSLKW